MSPCLCETVLNGVEKGRDVNGDGAKGDADSVVAAEDVTDDVGELEERDFEDEGEDEGANES